MHALLELESLSRCFGLEAARRKAELLDELGNAERLSAAQRRALGHILCFMRAYPDNPSVRRSVTDLAGTLPPVEQVHAYSYGVLLRLAELMPGELEIDWSKVEDETSLFESLGLLILPGECQALEGCLLPLSVSDWLERNRIHPDSTDLELLLRLFEQSTLEPMERMVLFESHKLPVRYRGLSSAALEIRTGPIRYQRRAVERERFALPPVIRRPLAEARRGGQPVLDFALRALATRKLEIYPLIYANPDDVILADCGRGVTIVLAGVLPEWRSALEALYFFLVLKNGVPVGYGPASVLCGCTEMGINLFPEFRGGEIRYIYAQVMRVLHHQLGIEYFYVSRYGMGVENEEALKSGAFWFYRKLGFRPTNPAVEELARAEERRMADDPAYRSNRRMLRRLSKTEVCLDLSGGRLRPVDVVGLGFAESRHVTECFGGDRSRAKKACTRRVARILGIRSTSRALTRMAPVLSLIPDVEAWPRRDKAALRRIVVAKDARSETRAARLMAEQVGLREALRKVALLGEE